MSGNPPSRHLWVGGLPEEVGEGEIKELFTKYGKVEGVKILPQRYPNQGVAAFVDFYDVRSAVDAKEDKIVYGGCELRTNFKTKPTERFEHSRRDQEYGKESLYSGKRTDSSPPPLEKEKEKSKDKEKSCGKESSSSSTSSSSSSDSSSSDGSSSDSEGGSKRARKKIKTEIDTLFLKITNLASRPERVLQDGLYYEFTRYSPTAVVRMYGDDRDASAIVKFQSKECCKKAYTEAQGLVLFGNKLKLSPVDRDDFPSGGRDVQVGAGSESMSRGYTSDDIDPQATHSLFVGNIPKNISVYELRDIFQRYGDVVDVEIKKMSGNATYGFVLFYDLLSAVSAKQYMDGENIHGNNIRVGFGKGTPSKMLWVDGIDPDMSESALERAMSKYGKVVRLGIDRQGCSAMVQFDSIETAKEALSGVKGTYIGNSRRIMTDFANRDARAAFFARVEGGDQVGPPRSFPGPGMYGPGGMGPGPRGMMMPRPGVPMMGMGRGGFPPMAGPPMEMYYYNPYMGEGMSFYGQPHFPRGPPMRGMRRYHGRGRVGPGGGEHFEEGYDDFGDELRAFTRKREIEKEERKWKERRRRHSSSESVHNDSEDGSVSHPHRKKKSSRDKDKSRKTKKDKSKDDDKRKDAGTELSSGEEEVTRKEEARLRATQRSRDLREKLKKKNPRRERKGSNSDAEPSDDDNDLRKTLKKTHEKDKEKDRNNEQDQEKDSGNKDCEVKIKGKTRSSEKGSDHKKERGSDRKTEHSKSASDKQHTSKKNSSRESTRNRPQHTKFRDRSTTEKSSRSNSESKTPTSPTIAISPPSKTMSPPKTPPMHPKEHVAVEEIAKEIENVDIQLDSLETSGQMKRVDKLDSDVEGDEHPGTHNVPETPESPPALPSKTKEQKVESDLSSGEEFPEDPSGSPALSPQQEKRKEDKVLTESEETLVKKEPEPIKFKMKLPSHTRMTSSRGVVSPHTARWSPDPSSSHSHHSPPSQSHQSPHNVQPGDSAHYSPPASSHHSGGEELEEGFHKSKKLPRCYQVEEERMRDKQREVKEHHHNKPHPPPTTPSPPPAYATHRRRPAYSPPSDYGDRRWRQRGHHYSPGHQFGARHYSRSPPLQGYPQSPPTHGGRSPYSVSPPPRPRTPIQRPRDRGVHRYRYESPPYDIPRSKYSRHVASPMHRMSPSPPLSRPRSPGPGRRHVRRYSRSLSPPKRSPRRKERTPSPGSSRSSFSEDRLEARKYSKKPPHVYSRSPSPKPKRREGGIAREDYPDTKRRRMEEGWVKSPASAGPHATKDEQLLTSKQPPCTSERHISHQTVVGKEQHHPTQGGGAHVSATSRTTHQANQVKASTSPSVDPHSTGGSSAASVQPPQAQQPADNLMDLLRRYPVMWQGHLTLKNESAAVQLHFLSGNVQLAKSSLPGSGEGRSPALRIAQRMRLEPTQLEGVQRRMQNELEHCLLLALPCGRDAGDVRTQTHALKNSLISYLLQKQAAGIINVQGSQAGFVLHIFPPCQFSQTHLSRVAPDLLSSASDNCHLMIIVATM